MIRVLLHAPHGRCTYGWPKAPQSAAIRSRRSLSTLSVFPCFQSLNAAKNRRTIARWKGRNNTTIGLKLLLPPSVRNTQTMKDHLGHLPRAVQLSVIARRATKGRIWVSMYSFHMVLSEETKSTSFPCGSHQSQTSRYTMPLFRTYKINPTTASGSTIGRKMIMKIACRDFRPRDFLSRFTLLKSSRMNVEIENASQPVASLAHFLR